MEHAQLAEIAALVGALGAVLALITRGGIFPLTGLGLLGVATGGLAWALVGDDDVKLLLEDPGGVALVAVGVAAAIVCAVPLARYPAAVPVALLAVAPFRVPVQLGNDEAFLLLPLYLAIAAAVLALAYRVLRGERPPPPPFLLALPLAAFVTLASTSFLWTWDERAGGIALAFFVFPFVAGLATVARSPIADWLPRALLVTLVALGTLFAAIGIWQAHTRTLFFGRDVEVANAYTSFFRVTSLFKDPSLYGRYLVVPIAVLLVAILVRRGRTLDWVVATAFVAFLFVGLFYSYSQSSFVALFVVTFAVAVVGADRQDAHRPPRLRARGDARRRRRRRGVDRRSLGEGRHERTLATRDGHARRVPGAPRRGCRRGRPAARELGDRPEGLTEPERVAHEPAHGARRARRHRLRPLPLAPRGHGLGARARLPHRPDLRRRPGRRSPRARGALAALRRLLRGSADLGRHRAHRSCSRRRLPERSAAAEPATDTAPAAPELLAH